MYIDNDYVDREKVLSESITCSTCNGFTYTIGNSAFLLPEIHMKTDPVFEE